MTDDAAGPRSDDAGREFDADVRREPHGPIEPGIHEASGPADAVVAELRAAGWRVGVVDGPESRSDALDSIGEALDFPAWYGRNLDALWDCLTDLRKPTALVWARWSRLALRRPDDWARVLEVLTDRTLEAPAFAVVFTGD